jgi:hypothetical protein
MRHIQKEENFPAQPAWSFPQIGVKKKKKEKKKKKRGCYLRTNKQHSDQMQGVVLDCLLVWAKLLLGNNTCISEAIKNTEIDNEQSKLQNSICNDVI